MSNQEQFLDVIDRDEAERRFRSAVRGTPLVRESVSLGHALGRVLAGDVTAEIDVPSFDRSNFDGFAVRAEDTFGAQEETPRHLQLLAETIATAVVPQSAVEPGTALAIATGGMLPRGADAVVMVEHTDTDGETLIVRRAVTSGHGVAFAGTDIAQGELVLHRGQVLSSRETGVLAALGVDQLSVWMRPRVAIISTGDEIIAPGQAMRPGMVFDSNARIIADAVREQGGEPVELGIVRDDMEQLRAVLREAIAEHDVVLLSGGTSKGAGDLSYRVVQELDDPGIVAHGVALKPGKPICLAATNGKPVVILPGFPTSAVFTFHEFVAPLVRGLAGRPEESPSRLPARLAVRVNSEIGRTEFLLVGLVEAAESSGADPDGDRPLVAYPMGKGSGSVTTFSAADGFFTIDRHEEIVAAGSLVTVQLLGRDLQVADLVVIGSHCVGLDYVLGQLQQFGVRVKFLAVGSTAGLAAARRGECDVAGIHLVDEASGQYNLPFMDASLTLLPGYGRRQGIVFRPGDERFQSRTAAEVIAAVKHDPACLMVNRNRGSGTRILIDQLISGARPNGYAVQSRSHNAVAAAVVQGRADWGVAIKTVADQAQLGFLPVTLEQYDFVIPRSRQQRPAVKRFMELLAAESTRHYLAELGMAQSRESRVESQEPDEGQRQP